MTISALEGDYSVYRFDVNEPLPTGAYQGPGFVSLTSTPDEVSVVCRSGSIQNASKEEAGWTLWRVQGPLDLGMIGVLSSISAVLAEAGVSIFSISTYDTDYLLWKKERAQTAVRALRSSGFEVEELLPH